MITLGEFDPKNKETAVYGCMGIEGLDADYELLDSYFGLGQLIEYLEGCDQDYVCSIGFTNAHSWRGCYDELAFEPARNVKISYMLDLAKKCLGREFQGYKGGWFTMTESTDVWLAYEGQGGGQQIGSLLIKYMTGNI